MSVKRLCLLIVVAVTLGCAYVVGCFALGGMRKPEPEPDVLQHLCGATKQAVIEELGEPHRRSTHLFHEGMRDLTEFIEPGQWYEQWDYVDSRGDTHTLYFSDSSQPQADPSEWTVRHTATRKKGAVD